MIFSSETLFMLHHKVWSSQIRTLWVRSTRSHCFVIDLNLQNLYVHFSLTDPSLSVIPSSLSWSRFSISVQPIWTIRSYRVAVTACDSASRCHRVVPLGHTDRVRLYIPPGQNLEIPPKPFARAYPALPTRVSGSSPHRQWPPATGLRRCQRESSPPLSPSGFITKLGYELDPLCHLFLWFLH